MPSKPKYNYDIKEIQVMENKGLSRHQIAKVCGWPQPNMEAWLKRNYKRVESRKVEYTPL